MQLRDYSMRDRVLNWPPIWVERYEHNKRRLKGEIGVLKSVGSDCGGAIAKCHLYITYRRKSYVGTLLFDDPQLCDFIAAFLKEHCGEQIKDIGSLDISEAL